MYVDQTALPASVNIPSGLAARFLQAVVSRVRCGSIRIELPSGETITANGAEKGPQADISIHDWRALLRAATAGDLGFAGAYIDEEWSSANLPDLIEFLARNGDALAAARRSFGARLLTRIWHFAHTNSRTGSRRNISFHYDLGNDFYRRWLDAGMQYSSGIYAPGDTLELAQARKLDRIAELLDLSGGESVLEIGCGWGALAEHVLERDCSVTGLTLSHEQAAFARGRLAKYEARADIRLQDYRDADGRFDRIMSVEMIEAVGEKYWPSYFDVLRARTKEKGRVVIQAITIHDDRFDRYRRNPDFIQRHIFPGGMLPTVSIMCDHAHTAGFELVHSETFGLSYAKTLADWRRRFHSAGREIETLGFDRRFMRMWDYYLAYCEGGFRAGTIDVGLYVFENA